MDNSLLLILLAVAALLAIGGYLFVRSRRPAQEEPYCNFKCPGCGRKLRYRPRQAGNSGMCPRCNKAFTFPALPRR